MEKVAWLLVYNSQPKPYHIMANLVHTSGFSFQTMHNAAIPSYHIALRNHNESMSPQLS
jgi:hypothetical protein